MTNYTFSNDFSVKDGLPTGDPDKAIKGSDIDPEFEAIETAISSKADANDAALTGDSTAVNLTVSGTLDATGTLQINSVSVTATAAELNILDGADASLNTLTLPDNTTISTFGASLIDDADAAAARTTLGVDASGSDNSTDVTLTGSGTYISISGQEITVDELSASDVTSGTFADARISESSVTQHQTAVDAGSVDGYNISVLSQTAYDALTPDANTLYFING